MELKQPSMLTASDIAAYDADAELIILGQRFDIAWNKQQHIEALASNDEAGDALLSDAVEATSCIVDQIEQLPAATLQGFRIKAKAVSWCQAGQAINLHLGPDPKPRADIQLANGILNDLLTCQAMPDRLALMIDAANRSPLSLDQIEVLTRNLELKTVATVCFNARLLAGVGPV